MTRAELKNLTYFLPLKATRGERLFCIQNGLSSRPKCHHCNENEVSFHNGKYRKFCSVSCSASNKDTRNKYKQTNLERYGVENPSQSDDIKNKKIETTLKNYGVENPFQSEQIKIEIKKICLERYGVEYANQSDVVKNKIIMSNLLKYGAEHPNQNPIILQKNQSYKTKKIKINNEEILYQGYENVAWFYLLNNGYNIADIKHNKKDVPRIEYYNKSKKHYYFPDFYISKDNLIIEVKSTWTYKKFFIINQLKKQSSIDAGYNFEFWICSDKKILEIIK